MRGWMRLYPLYRPYLGWLLISILAAVTAALAGAGLMAVAGWFIAAMAVAGATTHAVNTFTASALVRLFAILRAGARYGERVIGHEATLRVVVEARAWLFQRLAPLAPAALQDLSSGEALTRLKTDIDRLETLFLRVIAPFATAAISTTAIFAFAYLYDPALALVFAGLALAAGVALPLGFAPRARTATVVAARLQGERRSRLVDALDGLGELTMSGAFGRRFDEAVDAFDRQLDWEAREQGVVEISEAALTLATDVGVIAALAMGAIAIGAGALAVSDATMLVLLVAAGFEPLAALPAAFAAAPAAAASLDRILELADRRPVVADPAAPLPMPRGFALALEDVGFAYPGAPRPALDGVTLNIAEGERVAFVGPSGAGKTTLTELLIRVRDPVSGVVRLGGAAENRLPLEALRSRFAVAPQFPHLFDRSLADNLRLGRPEATDAELARALEVVGLGSLVAELPRGIDSDIGPLGAKLSVGQARRVAVARALVSDAPILALDEPTEGLDAASERRLIDGLIAETAGRTLILITHGAYPASRVDAAYVVENGKLRARGEG
ncbi:MAG: thiol reductant ABC exporter subunit CydC [Roseiarcus sp.]